MTETTGGCECGAVRYAVKAGTLDDTSGLVPQVHLWTRRKQPWVVIPEGAECYETQPG